VQIVSLALDGQCQVTNDSPLVVCGIIHLDFHSVCRFGFAACSSDGKDVTVCINHKVASVPHGDHGVGRVCPHSWVDGEVLLEAGSCYALHIVLFNGVGSYINCHSTYFVLYTYCLLRYEVLRIGSRRCLQTQHFA
jgi:hypothetical protein